MEFDFIDKDINQVVKDISVYVKIIPNTSLKVCNGGWIQILISKLGTSTLSFKLSKNNAGTHLILGDQEIAWLHRAHISEVKTKIKAALRSLGGIEVM